MIGTIYGVGAAVAFLLALARLICTWKPEDKPRVGSYFIGTVIVALVWPIVLCWVVIYTIIAATIEGIRFRREQ